MPFRPDSPAAEFTAWLDGDPDEDALRDAYLALETRRAQLWTPGHPDSYARDRYDLDALYVTRLRTIKQALATRWIATGQVKGLPTAV
jgi:hypothetical protein